MIKYDSNWRTNLDYDQWSDFLEFSKQDKNLNQMWISYHEKSLSYLEIDIYEYNLYVQWSREKKLNQIL